MNTITAFFKSKNFTAHTFAALCVATAGIITTDPQVQQILVGLFKNHPAALADVMLLAGLILKYMRSSSDAGTLATAREIHASGNAPTAAEVDAASMKG
jgi:hypothetical protein